MPWTTAAPVRRLVALAAACAAVLPATAQAQQAGPPGDVIVAFEPGATASARADARAGADVKLVDTLPVRGLQVVEVPGSVAQAIDQLEEHPGVRYAVPNVPVHMQLTPNDPDLGLLWGLHQASDADIDAPEAWDVTTGSSGVTVAVVDTGIAAHADLDANRWTNPGETGGGKETNGIDDDGNGLVDDWRGWNFADGNNDPDDTDGHGTHVAGTVGAVGNNGIGVTGVAWNVRLMALDVFGTSDVAYTSDIVAAFAYAGAKGARVVNASLGGGGSAAPYVDVLAANPRTLYVVAAGNGGADGIGDNNDATPQVPCNTPSPNLICVAASNASDARTSWSNYGATSVDLAAPGSAIRSTLPGNSYGSYSGTSMASPHVAGAAALLVAHRPDALAGQLKSALLDSADPIASWAGLTVTGARLNANAALARLTAIYTPPGAPANSAAPAISGVARVGTSLQADPGTWTNEPTFAYQWQRCDASGNNCANIAATARNYAPTAADRDLTLRVRVTASSEQGTGTAESAVTAAVAGPPRNTALPAVTGTVREGETLSATTGSWLDSPTSYSYTWQRCSAGGGSCFDLATGSTYKLALGDVGKEVRVRVRAANVHGATNAVSGLSGGVTPRPPAFDSKPWIYSPTGEWISGHAVSAATGATVSANDSVSVVWHRCDAAGGGCAQATGSGFGYALSDADAGATLRITVTISNASGTATATSDPTPVIRARETGGTETGGPETGGTFGVVGPTGDDPVLPAATARVTRVTIAGRRTATVTVRCTSATPCSGTLTLSYKRTRLGRVKVDLAGGAQRSFRIRIASAAARKLPRRGRIRVTTSVRLDGAATQTRAVTARLK